MRVIFKGIHYTAYKLNEGLLVESNHRRKNGINKASFLKGELGNQWEESIVTGIDDQEKEDICRFLVQNI